MSNDQPTLIRRPNPGGRRRHRTYPPTERHSSRPAPAPAADAYVPSIPRADSKGLNPLVEAATTLLSLASQLSTQTYDPGVTDLRKQVSTEIRTFERAAKNRGIDVEIVDKASYALCTFIDEAVMHTPWGGDGFWEGNTLLAEFHRETWGGEKFFEILKEARDDPSRNLELLELMYLCLAFGFGGIHKDSYETERLRRELHEQIRRHRGEVDPQLSPHWQGIETRRRLIRHIPLWLIGVVTLVLCVLSYAGFYRSITEVSYPVYGQLENIQPKLMMVDLPDVTVRTSPPEPDPFDAPHDSYVLKFVTRGDRLTDAHKQVIQAFVDRVNAYPDYHSIGIEILGRASPTPPGADRYNQKLSEKRAKSVLRALKGEDGRRLPTVNVVSVEGLGAYKDPLQPRAGYNETYNEINQSVEIRVVHQKKD